MVPTNVLIEIPSLLGAKFTFANCRLVARHWRECATVGLQSLLALCWHVQDSEGKILEEEIASEEVDWKVCKSAFRFDHENGQLVLSVATMGSCFQRATKIFDRVVDLVGLSRTRDIQDIRIGFQTQLHMERLLQSLLSINKNASVNGLFPKGSQLRRLAFYRQVQVDSAANWLSVLSSGIRACSQLQHLVWWAAGGEEMPHSLEQCLVNSAASLSYLQLFSFGHGFGNRYNGKVYRAFEGHKCLQTFELLTEYGDSDMLINASSLITSLLNIPNLNRLHCLVLGNCASAATSTLDVLQKIISLASRLESFGGLPVPAIYGMLHPVRVISPWDRRIDPLSTVLDKLTEVSIIFYDLALVDDLVELEAALLPLPKFLPSLRILRLVFADTPSMFGTFWKGESWDMTLIRCLATAERSVLPFRLEELHVHTCSNCCAASRQMDLVRRARVACPFLQRVLVSHKVMREQDVFECGDSFASRSQTQETCEAECLCSHSKQPLWSPLSNSNRHDTWSP